MFRKNVIIYFIIAIIIFLELCLLNILTKIDEKLSFRDFFKTKYSVFFIFYNECSFNKIQQQPICYYA